VISPTFQLLETQVPNDSRLYEPYSRSGNVWESSSCTKNFMTWLPRLVDYSDSNKLKEHWKIGPNHDADDDNNKHVPGGIIVRNTNTTIRRTTTTGIRQQVPGDTVRNIITSTELN
jgi:hypothetical protein